MLTIHHPWYFFRIFCVVVLPNSPSVQQAPKVTGDIFYGYEDLSKMCGRFIGALFSCPNVPLFASGSSSSGASCPPLAHFIAYAIHRTRLPEVVVFTSLFLLARLKERFPAARGSSGHRLFISAFMIASKVVCDDTYSNKSWCIVGQNLYTLKEVNQMEREMCSYLEWILHVEAAELEAFTQRVKKEYGAECGPNPPQWVSTPAVPTSSSSSSTVVAPLVSPVESSSAATRPTVVPTAPAQSYPSPRSSPPTPVTSNTASPASSDSDECPTPPSGEDQAAIAASTHAPTDTTIKAKHIHQSSGHVGIASSDPSFAFAGPTVW
ncbi:hypothetical protein FRB91_003248 [Serendipita sp. 411]|nr:hypothetical protein FRB91_003248 [Serendipita sp. 411]